MRKIAKIVTVAVVFIIVLALSLSSVAFAENYTDNVGNPDNPGIGPAPNFGDGIPDGPGW